MAGPGNLPLRSTGHPSTGRPVELHSSVTGRPVPTEPDPKQPKQLDDTKHGSLRDQDVGIASLEAGPETHKRMLPRRRNPNPSVMPNEQFMEAMYAAFQGMATRAQNERPAEDRK
ncbi:hypothetical protein L484_011103 [Morus notabilis]|uniref:Uncharacterized protein n=1 Tax=Morus notabilis TaxID=981085 RepID=W9QQ69_9ROSA|nr:hypothetical protein L484_011103 [Morus notabilis]